jgi:hypothetical protein
MLVTPAALRAHEPHAAAVRAADDLHVESRLQRLEPAVDHAHRRVGLGRGERFEQLVGGARVVDQVDLQPVALEVAALLRHHHRREAERGGVPCEGELARLLRERLRGNQAARGDHGGSAACTQDAAARKECGHRRVPEGVMRYEPFGLSLSKPSRRFDKLGVNGFY